jgi:hypothetical protein
VSPSPLGGVMGTTTFASARAGTSASGRRTGQGVLPSGGFCAPLRKHERGGPPKRAS